jgi:hypothetical protein
MILEPYFSFYFEYSHNEVKKVFDILFKYYLNYDKNKLKRLIKLEKYIK